MDAKELIGKEIVDAVDTEDGMELLFDDGLILTIASFTGGVYRGDDWAEKWQEIVDNNS